MTKISNSPDTKKEYLVVCITRSGAVIQVFQSQRVRCCLPAIEMIKAWAPSLLAGDPGGDALIEDVQWQRTGVDDLVVEGADVELGA